MKNLKRFAVMGFAALAATAGSVAGAQDASKYYTVMHPEKFDIDWGKFYRDGEARTAAVRKALPNHLNMAYGKDPKQKVDLYLPQGKFTGAPVFLFLHGGGFREGDRAQYGFIAGPYAKHGIITAVASYRLTGDGFKFPDQENDAKAAIQWLYQNVAKYGGDANRLYVGGHSAGAILSAEVGVDTGWMTKMGMPQSVLRGIAPVSGRFDLRSVGIPGESDVYAPTPALAEQASALLHVTNPVPAAVITVGSKEDAVKFVANSEAFAKKLNATESHAQFILMKGADHKDTALALADESSELFKAVLKMILAPPAD